MHVHGSIADLIQSLIIDVPFCLHVRRLPLCRFGVVNVQAGTRFCDAAFAKEVTTGKMSSSSLDRYDFSERQWMHVWSCCERVQFTCIMICLSL